MSEIFSQYSKQFAISFVFICFPVLGEAVFAESFNYFNKDIDYWHDRQSVEPTKEAVTKKQEALPQDVQTPSQTFTWGKFLDPKNKDFFREGDYSPPEPFQEVVRNPTDHNIKMWFAYIEKKNEIFSTFQKKIHEFQKKNATPTGSRKIISQKMARIEKVDQDAKRFRFRLYFDSTCPHCKEMFSTMKTLQAKGFFVEARQLDSGPIAPGSLTIPVEKAEPNEIKKKDIQSVPLLLIGDLKKQVVYRMTGFQTVDAIFSEIQQNATSP